MILFLQVGLIYQEVASKCTTYHDSKKKKLTSFLSKLVNLSWRYRPDLNWRITVLQTGALPLGYGTIWNKERLGVPCFFGAGDEARTRYLHLGKVALYRMSYTRILVPPVGIEPTTRGFSVRCSTYWATEAYEERNSPHCAKCDFMATPNGLEPSTSSVTGWRANRLHHRAM